YQSPRIAVVGAVTGLGAPIRSRSFFVQRMAIMSGCSWKRDGPRSSRKGRPWRCPSPLRLRRAPTRSQTVPVGREVRPGATQRPGTVLGAHAIDGLVAGRLAPGVVELELAGFAGEAAQSETEQAQ